MPVLELRKSEEPFILSFPYDERITSVVKSFSNRNYDLEKGIGLRNIQEIYTYVSKSNISRIKNPMDDIMENNNL